MGKHNLSKATLEKIKLDLEIAELKKPLVHKPAFYAVVGPTLLALGTLGLGFSTGLFNAQKTLLEIEKIHLKSETEDVQRKRVQIENETKAINQQLIDQRKQLAETLESERAKMTAQLEPLQKRLVTVEDQIKTKNRELDELPIQTLLDQMKSAMSLDPFNQSSNTLTELLKKDNDKVKLLDDRLNRETDPVFNANVLYVIYQVTQDPQRLKNLLEFIAAKTNPDTLKMWPVIGSGRWNVHDAPDVMKFILANAEKLGSTGIGQALQFFQFPPISVQVAKQKLSIDEQAAMFSLGRKIALDITVNRNPRFYGIQTASFFVPQAFPILAGTILANPDEPEDVKAEIREQIRVIHSGLFKERATILKALNELEFPKDAQTGLDKWRKIPAVEKWTVAIMGSDLKKLLN